MLFIATFTTEYRTSSWYDGPHRATIVRLALIEAETQAAADDAAYALRSTLPEEQATATTIRIAPQGQLVVISEIKSKRD